MDETMLRKPATPTDPEPAIRRLEQALRRHERGAEREIDITCFDEWTDFYDADMIALGFNGYEDGAKKLREVLPQKSAKILDLGCGTGGMGAKLKSIGYENIHGVDASPESIKTASKKNAYVKLDVVDLDGNTSTPYDDGFFDGVAAIAVFNGRSITHRVFPEINRLLRPGGFLVTYVRKSSLEMETEKFNIKAAFESYVAQGLWTRFPDERNCEKARYYRPDLAVTFPDDEGVVVTIKKL